MSSGKSETLIMSLCVSYILWCVRLNGTMRVNLSMDFAHARVCLMESETAIIYSCLFLALVIWIFSVTHVFLISVVELERGGVGGGSNLEVYVCRSGKVFR